MLLLFCRYSCVGIFVEKVHASFLRIRGNLSTPRSVHATCIKGQHLIFSDTTQCKLITTCAGIAGKVRLMLSIMRISFGLC
jgi:hypothetical protein